MFLLCSPAELKLILHVVIMSEEWWRNYLLSGKLYKLYSTTGNCFILSI